MVLCVWTAVHLNIPARGERFRTYLIKAGWLTMGIFAPEIVSLAEFAFLLIPVLNSMMDCVVSIPTTSRCQ